MADLRGELAATWTASVTSTVFSTGTGSGPETIGKARLSYVPGLPTHSTPGVFTAKDGVLDAPLAAYTGAATGTNSVTWNPTVTVDLSAGQVSGMYTGTITHSVS